MSLEIETNKVNFIGEWDTFKHLKDRIETLIDNCDFKIISLKDNALYQTIPSDSDRKFIEDSKEALAKAKVCLNV
jgi:hypothetical protein